MQNDKQQTIILPSLLRRTLKAYALKALIRSTGAQLYRIGRSRNWQLISNQKQLQQIIQLIEIHDEISWQWLVPLLRKYKAQFSHQELVNLIKLKPSITLNELLLKTDCTLSQARLALDEVEGFSD
jgi:hypothetical protein